MAILQLPASPAGQISHNDVREKVNEIAALVSDKFDTSFYVSSTTNITIGVDPANPSFLGPVTAIDMNGFTLFDSVTGAIQNTSGATIPSVAGAVSFQPNKSGGGTTTLSLVSERSTDNGVTWTINANSLRVIEISNSGETFSTKFSFASNWQPNEIIRFRAYSAGGGAITFQSPTDTILGQTVDGLSYAWFLQGLL